MTPAISMICDGSSKSSAVKHMVILCHPCTNDVRTVNCAWKKQLQECVVVAKKKQKQKFS